MPQISQYEPGSFCWADLSTRDQQAVKPFYTGIFGWETAEDEIPGGVYVRFLKGDKDVAACYKQGEEEKGVPPHWNSYVSVDDVDLMVKRAEEADGKVMAPPFDVMEIGRMAVIADPTGAPLSLWQPKTHIGATVTGEPAARMWNELITPDTSTARDYLTGLFGWQADEQKMPDRPPYTVFIHGGKPEAGMMAPEPEWGMPPTWVVYFGVDSAEAAVAKARDLGGQVPFDVIEVPNTGKVAWIMDPQGAAFGILEPAAMA